MRDIRLFVVVEDKKEEQVKALEAIKMALSIEEDAENAGRIIPGSPMFSFSKANILVHFAGELGTAIHRIGFIMGAKSAGVDTVGIITDLMFPKNIGGKEEPNGFSVIAECITHDIPVVVCSDIDHHEVGYLGPIFPILGRAHPRGEIPIILDDKDWGKAVSSLLRIRKE